jgi:hypothetical protein
LLRAGGARGCQASTQRCRCGARLMTPGTRSRAARTQRISKEENEQLARIMSSQVYEQVVEAFRGPVKAEVLASIVQGLAYKTSPQEVQLVNKWFRFLQAEAGSEIARLRRRADSSERWADFFDRQADYAEGRAAELRAKAEARRMLPPSGAVFLLACVARRGREDEVLGDAECQYLHMIARLSPRQARWWYRIYVLRVASAMLPGAFGRLLILHKLLGLWSAHR